MSIDVNVEAKHTLARLLAAENIWIRHAKVQTAKFDMANRVLTFPIWKEMSDDLYTMLCGHEVGHAIWSDPNFIEALKKIDPDPKNLGLVKQYFNIIEDVRIERLIQELYPGLSYAFSGAYKEMVERNRFHTLNKDLQKKCFIDRTNLYFKAGDHLQVIFSAAEYELIKKIAGTLTSNDVMEVTEEVYNWAKLHEVPGNVREIIMVDMDIPEEFNPHYEDPGEDNEDDPILVAKSKSEDSEFQGSQESEEENEDGGEGDKESKDNKPKKSQPKSKDGEGDGEGKEDKKPGSGEEKKQPGSGDEKSKEKSKGGGKSPEKDDDAGDGEDGAGEESEEEKPASGNGSGAKTASKKEDAKDTQGTEAQAGGVSGKPPKKQPQLNPMTAKPGKSMADMAPPPKPDTQDAFDEDIEKHVNKTAQSVNYVTLPKPNLEKIIVDYTKVHEVLRNHFPTATILKAEQDMLQFTLDNQPKIDYIVQEFEQQKQADMYDRIRLCKTGAIDTLRLHSYKYDDELFRSIAIVKEGKNHGLLFVVDWSSSMTENMAGTLEQLIVLCLFCQRVNVPFEVYSLTVDYNNNYRRNYGYSNRYDSRQNSAFECEPGNLLFAQNFSMRNYLSSRMSPKEFQAACAHLFAMMPNRRWKDTTTEDSLIGCTPLDEAAIVAMDLIEQLRKETNAQIVNAIFLTDGGANTVNHYITETGTIESMYNGGTFVIDDHVNHRVYSFAKEGMTPTLLRILRDRQGINVIGFFVETGSYCGWQHFFPKANSTSQLTKEYQQNGFLISTDWGYNELYVIKGGTSIRVKELALNDPKVGTTADRIDALAKSLEEQQASIHKQRIMLDRFVSLIAKDEPIDEEKKQ